MSLFWADNMQRENLSGRTLLMSLFWADNMQRENLSGRTLLMSLFWADNMQRENLSGRTLLMSLSWADNMQRETPRRTFRREMVYYIRRPDSSQRSCFRSCFQLFRAESC